MIASSVLGAIVQRRLTKRLIVFISMTDGDYSRR